jgi:hypothetical protein
LGKQRWGTEDIEKWRVSSVSPFVLKICAPSSIQFC